MIFFCQAIPSLAEESIVPKTNQINIHFGMVSGSFSGPSIQGSISVANSLDFQYEMFSTVKTSRLFRATLSHDLKNWNMDYFFAGLGRRHYFLSQGLQFDKSDDKNKLSVVPIRRYYWGYSLGLSQVSLSRLGPILQISSTLLDLSFTSGAMIRINNRVSFDAQFDLGFGYGISSISVAGTVVKVLLGVSYVL